MRRLKVLGRPGGAVVSWAAFLALAAWLWGTHLSAAVHPPAPWVPAVFAVLLAVALVAVALTRISQMTLVFWHGECAGTL